jgi:hypothetical protein
LAQGQNDGIAPKATLRTIIRCPKAADPPIGDLTFSIVIDQFGARQPTFKSVGLAIVGGICAR